jgi:hypothetical protein
MSPKPICYPDLDYILQINSKYSLFFCLPEIDNSKISLELFPVAKSAAIIYLFLAVVV